LGYGLSALTKPLLYVAGAWELVAAVRVVDRLGKGIRTPARDALIADSAPAGWRGLNFGSHRAGDTAGAVIGLAIAAGVVFLLQRDAPLLTPSTYRVLVLLGVIPGLLAVAVLWAFVREPRRHDVGGATAVPVRLGLDPPLVRFLIVTALFALGNSSDAFLVLRAQSLGLSVLEILAVLVGFNLVYAIVAAPAGVLSDRLGRTGLLLLAWGCYVGVYAGFAFASVRWHVYALYLGYGVYYGISEGVARALVADLARPERRGLAYGAYNAAVGVAALPASLTAGVLWQGAGPWPGLGPRAPFLFGATMAGIAAVLLWSWVPTKLPA
jgi:MFS family permease